jgi:hypothetical protein
MIIAVPKNQKLGQGYSKTERLKADEDAGRPWTRPAGGWISDLAELQKFIMLCPFCISKFNPRRAGYEVWRQNIYGVGKCDGCKQMSTYIKGFISEALHQTVGEWERPRKGRWVRR